MTVWGLFAVCGPTLGRSISHKISPDTDWSQDLLLADLLHNTKDGPGRFGN